MKRLTKFAVLGLVVMGVVSLPVTAHYRAKSRLKAHRLQFRAGGVNLTSPELQPAVSPEEIKAGSDLLAAASLLRSSYTSPPSMKMLAPGRALAVCREAVVPTEDWTKIWAGLASCSPQMKTRWRRFVPLSHSQVLVSMSITATSTSRSLTCRK